jgi:hypothetical protein
MSETTETPSPGEGEPAPEPQPAPDAPETEQPTPEQEEERKSRGDRRFAVVTAQLSAAQREREALRAEVETYRRQLAQQAPEQDTPEQAEQRLRHQIRAEVEAEIKVSNFHNLGRAQYADWTDRTQRLIDMGADPGFAQLLIDMPPNEAVRVVGALAEDPEALQRIADLRNERARAVALGKFAATIEDTPAGRPAMPERPVTRAPAPVRPVTGRAAPVFNEYTADAQTLADRYMRQIVEQQQRR